MKTRTIIVPRFEPSRCAANGNMTFDRITLAAEPPVERLNALLATIAAEAVSYGETDRG